MDVVADAGAIGGGVVIAVQHQLTALPASDLKHDRYQVAFRMMPLAQPPDSTGGVEVPQACRGQAEWIAPASLEAAMSANCFSS
jgi:hypothetical protein